MLTSTVLLFQLSLFAPPPADPRFPSPLDEVREELTAAVRRFDQLWRQAWEISLQTRTLPAPTRLTQRQVGLQHCHGQQSARTDPLFQPTNTMLMRSVQSGHFRCPTWLAGRLGQYVDESQDYDAIILDEQRPIIRQNRELLLRAVDVTRRRYPTDAALLGLHLRLLVDHNDLSTASAVVASCAVSDAVCALADGLLAERRGDALSADAAFRDPRIPAQWLCDDSDFLPMFGDREARRLTALSCDARLAWMDTLWWLTDPFWNEPGNERRSAHYARRVMVELRGMSRRDERFAWDDASGGDALRKAILWYGWPTVFAAGYSSDGRVSSTSLDASHSGYLVGQGYTGANPEPYTTLEYRRDRVSFMPPLAVRERPFATSDGAWGLSAPRLTNGAPDSLWWPDEHWLPPRPIADLAPGQTVFLRRDRWVHLVAARAVPSPELAGLDSTVVLIASRGPGDVVRVDVPTRRVPDEVVHRTDLDPIPRMVSVEVPRRGAPDAVQYRARFGIRPPPSLAALRPRELAISGPVIFHVTRENEVAVPDPELILPFATGSLSFASPNELGLYWETHGAEPGDTLDVAIWIERITGQGVIRNLGITLRVAQDLNTPVSVNWREPRPESASFRVPGALATIARSLVLNTSSLIAGRYRIEVAVARPGGEPARQSAEIEVKR